MKRRVLLKTFCLGLFATKAHAQPAATWGSIDTVDETGLASGRCSPGGSQIELWVDDDGETMARVTCDASGKWSKQLLVSPGSHLLKARTVSTHLPLENTALRFVRSGKQLARPAGAVTTGLAAKYVNDNGIEKDRDVVLAVDFSKPDWPTRFFNSGDVVAPLAERPVDRDPASGLPRVNMRYTPDGRFSPGYPSYMFSKAGKVGPDELFFRYYFMPKKGFQCTVSGKKLPGLAGRYGPYGNGGRPSTGRMEADGLSGWSARNLAFSAPVRTDPIALGTYLYHADMGTGFGQDFLWNCPMMEEEKPSCIEQQVVMNTINMSKVDARGNGVGNPDGVLRCWLDGRLAFEKTNVRYRHHPGIHVDEVWLSHYHGGTVPPEVVHPFAMWGVVAAKKYIGPINAGAPARKF